jgi:hypothetical protein
MREIKNKLAAFEATGDKLCAAFFSLLWEFFCSDKLLLVRFLLLLWTAALIGHLIFD